MCDAGDAPPGYAEAACEAPTLSVFIRILQEFARGG